MNPEDDRPGDFPISQYPVHMLPLNHLIDNLFVRGSLGVGFGMDGQGLYVSNITVEDCAGSGAYILAHETVFTNIAIIDTNTKNFPAEPDIYLRGLPCKRSSFGRHPFNYRTGFDDRRT
uniref:Tailspike n=1 Tax=Salmonella phage vB_SE130_2P TaxID=3236707 RepID=A0AB39C3B7_9VIRU